MGTQDNIIHDRGEGNWLFEIYQPNIKIGPIEGKLKVSKDHHVVYAEVYDENDRFLTEKCIASFPSQNVAYVVDLDHVHQ